MALRADVDPSITALPLTAALTDLAPPAVPAPRADEHRRRQVAPLLVHLIDVLAITFAGVAIALLPTGAGSDGPGAVLAILVLAPLVFCGGGTERRLTLRALDEVPRLCGWVGMCVLLVVPLALATGTANRLLAQAALTALAVTIGRAVAYGAIRRMRRTGVLRDRAVVVGAGVVGTEIERVLGQHPELGVDVVGFVDASLEEGRNILGDVDAIEEIIERHEIRRVIVAFGLHRESQLVDLLRRLALLDLDVHVVPRFFDIGVAPSRSDVDDVWGVPLYHVPRAGLRRPAWIAKRALDVTVAGTCLLLTFPLLLLFAVAVRIGSPGHPLFRQLRTGRDGRDFQLLKLRSLRPVAEDDQVIDLRTPGGIDDLAIQADRRVDVEQRANRIGAFVRRTCLDEVPQMWNIVVGDMSLVGPRPEEAQFARRFGEAIPGYRHRHRVPVGLTGWAQVNGLRGDTSIVERARFDNQYIEHWSLWNDLAIILRTVAAVGRSAIGRGERRTPDEVVPE